jgi:membrane protease subunit HflK
VTEHHHHHDHDHDHDHDHTHDHDHDHAHAHDHHHDVLHGDVGAALNIDELDPANRSLAEALRVSFGVLKLVMIVLVVWFFFSGLFMVDQGNVAIRLHLGSVTGTGKTAVYEPGGPYFAWPTPVDQVIKVPTGVQQITINRSFWFNVPPGSEALSINDMPAEWSLVPGRDGSLITGDQNIVHGQFTISYRITPGEAANFVRNVGFARTSDYSRDAEAPNYDPDYFAAPLKNRPLYRAEKLVRFIGEQCIVRAVAQVTADDFVRAALDRDRIRSAMQHELDALAAGLTVTEVYLQRPTPPLAVREAFAAVNQAESERARKLEDARRQASQILINTAGAAYPSLLEAIDAYEAARHRKDAAAITAADQRITELLTPDKLGGEVSTLIGEAVSYRRQIRQTLQAEREQFERLLPGYRENPGIVLDRLWQDTRQAVLSGDVETLYIPSDAGKTLYLDINRNPAVQKQREVNRYKQQLEQERGGGSK